MGSSNALQRIGCCSWIATARGVGSHCGLPAAVAKQRSGASALKRSYSVTVSVQQVEVAVEDMKHVAPGKKDRVKIMKGELRMQTGQLIGIGARPCIAHGCCCMALLMLHAACLNATCSVSGFR